MLLERLGIKSPLGLADAGILGINQRNAEFVFAYNSRALFPLVDDKAATKKLAMEADIAVPELYELIEIHQQIKRLPEILSGYDEFVIKPSQGSAGNGILVITGQDKAGYHTPSGKLLTDRRLKRHTSNIISGLYSLGGVADRVMIEYCVNFASIFADISMWGVPDIRVLCFLGYPVMAMMRLPTRKSDGKANLHQGAVGVGIRLDDGTTTSGVLFNKTIDHHPDTLERFSGRSIPHWDRILELSTRCYDLTGLGYLGVDIVMDEERGPLVLELNARPGLDIQTANGTGLLHRLRKVEHNADSGASPDQRIRSALDWFGG